MESHVLFGTERCLGGIYCDNGTWTTGPATYDTSTTVDSASRYPRRRPVVRRVRLVDRSKILVGVFAAEIALGAVLVVDTVSGPRREPTTSPVSEAYGFALARLLVVLAAVLVIVGFAVYRYRRYW